MQQQVIEALRAAREKISSPERWTQGTWARGANDRVAKLGNPAVCWCIWGALVPTESTTMYGVAEDAYEALRDDPAVGGCPIAYNDKATTTHADVLALFDRTIARLESEV